AVVFGDASEAYKRGARALEMAWRGQDKAKPKPKRSLGAGLSGSQRKRNRRNSAIRARVAHIFRVVKRQFGYRKARYRGLLRIVRVAIVVSSVCHCIH
ncbi:MAG: hypothetical protein ACREE9_21695, partial [Stellaceae bacterium]